MRRLPRKVPLSVWMNLFFLYRIGASLMRCVEPVEKRLSRGSL